MPVKNFLELFQKRIDFKTVVKINMLIYCSNMLSACSYFIPFQRPNRTKFSLIFWQFCVAIFLSVLNENIRSLSHSKVTIKNETLSLFLRYSLKYVYCTILYFKILELVGCHLVAEVLAKLEFENDFKNFKQSGNGILCI